MTGHYTCDRIVEEALDLIDWPATPGRLLDAGMGDGQFLLHAVRRLALAPDDIATLEARVEGWEVHPAAAFEGRARLVDHLVSDRGWSPDVAAEGAERVVIHADFLAPGPVERRYAIAIGNPPYCRYGRLPEALKPRYANVPRHARGDILHAFLDRCAELLPDTGRAVFITSDRWMMNEQEGPLREAIGQRFGIDALFRLDVTTPFYVPKTRRKGAPARVHPIVVSLVGASHAVRPLTKAPIYPGAPIVDTADAVTLGDVGTVRLAPWLGPHGIFTLDIEEADAKGIPDSVRVPCVDTDDVVNGVLQAPRRVALRTTRDVTPEASVLAHLEATRHRIPVSKRKVPFWVPPESIASFPWATEALMIPRIAKGIRPIRLPAGVCPLNHNLTVVAGVLPIEVLEAALTAPETQAWIMAHAPRLENGYYSITTNLLRRMPLPLPEAIARELRAARAAAPAVVAGQPKARVATTRQVAA